MPCSERLKTVINDEKKQWGAENGKCENDGYEIDGSICRA